MRGEEELLAAYDAATPDNRVILNTREVMLLTKILTDRNGRSVGSTGDLILNKEKVIGDGVRSVLDGRVYTNRKNYSDHLKANGCDVVGNDRASMTRKLKEEGNRARVVKTVREPLSKPLKQRIYS